jgi:orotate phosphoribosyltransferase
MWSKDMSLFQLKDFIMHSGGKGYFKIECDFLSKGDHETFAKIISKKYDFGIVRGVPTGGFIIEKHLAKYVNVESDVVLIVDDVLTTGNSMNEYRDILRTDYPEHEYKGVVLFARTKCPDWIEPVFQMWEEK